MYHYVAFNLCLASEVELPLLATEPRDPDVTLRLMPTSSQAGPPPKMEWSYHITRRFATLDYIDLGTLTLVEGREIRVTLLPHGDASLLPSYVIGTALAVLFFQRGLLVLRASSVALGSAAATFVSDSDGGKSALAALLVSRGHGLLADDFTVIDFLNGRPSVLPAFPFLQLNEELALRLGAEQASLWRLNPRGGKVVVPVDTFVQRPVPLRTVYLLRTGLENNLSYLPRQAGLTALIRNSYPACLLQPGGTDYVRQCSHLVGAIAVCQLSRRYELGELPELADMIEGHLSQSLLSMASLT